MTAYVIGNITLKDPGKWAEYRHTDTVVIRFPKSEFVVKWHDSPAYQAIVPLRMQEANVDLISYESNS